MSIRSFRPFAPPAGMKLLLVILFVIWSNAFTAIRHLREILDPAQLVLARFLPAAVFCLAYLLSRRDIRREAWEALRSAPLRLSVMGLTGIAGYNYFLYIGQSEVKPGAAALLTTLSPLFTVILAIILIRERVPLRRILGIVLAFAGLYLVVRLGKVGLGRIAGISHPEIKYAVITALAPLSWSIYTVLGKELLRNTSPVIVTFLTIILGTLPFLPAASPAFFRTVSSMGWTYVAALVHLTALCTLLGFWIWFTALKRLPATAVSSFIYLNPPFAAFFGAVFFGEEVTGYFLLGSAIVLAGLYLAQSGGNDRESAPSPPDERS